MFRLVRQTRELQQMVADLQAEKADLDSRHAEALQKERDSFRQIEAAEGHIERHRERAVQMMEERDKAEARARAKEAQARRVGGTRFNA